MALWTPAEITTALWLDASDASTITLSATNVSQWNDKSGNGRHATQTTAARRPAYTTAGKNGLNVVTFQSANTHWMSLPNSTNPSGANAVFVAAKPNNSSASAMIIGRAYNWGSWYLSSASTGTAGRYDMGRNAVDSASAIASGLTNDTDKIFSATYDNSNVSLSINAGSPTTAAYTPNPTYNTSDATAIGAFRDITNTVASTFNGPIYELVVLHLMPSTDTIQKVQGYFAWKWGLQANLPSDHPYKNGAPSIGGSRRKFANSLCRSTLFNAGLAR